MRPVLEVADIFRRHGDAFRAAQGSRLSQAQRRVMAAIEACRTAVLGGHVEQCEDCGEVRVAYNSCLMGRSSNEELAWFAHFRVDLRYAVANGVVQLDQGEEATVAQLAEHEARDNAQPSAHRRRNRER
jgi:Transposase zinc-binding domain